MGPLGSASSTQPAPSAEPAKCPPQCACPQATEVPPGAAGTQGQADTKPGRRHFCQPPCHCYVTLSCHPWGIPWASLSPWVALASPPCLVAESPSNFLWSWAPGDVSPVILAWLLDEPGPRFSHSEPSSPVSPGSPGPAEAAGTHTVYFSERRPGPAEQCPVHRPAAPTQRDRPRCRGVGAEEPAPARGCLLCSQHLSRARDCHSGPESS